MKTMMTRLVLLALVLVMGLGLIACGPTTGPGEEPGDNEFGDIGGEDRVDHGVTVEKYPEGTTFTVLHYEEGDWLVWDEIVPSTGMENRPGDLLGNDVFERAAWLEQFYGIELLNENLQHKDFAKTYETIHVTSGTDYQLVDYFSYAAQALVCREYFMNLNDIEFIDFEHPWWVDSAIESYSIGNFIEFAVSDMLLLDKGATAMVFYNLPMAEDLGITDLYQSVDNKTWTMEKMAEYAEIAWAAGDLNGDDTWDHNDQFGVISGDDPVHFLYIGSGNAFLKFDEEKEEYYYSYASNDETTDVMLGILEDMMYQDFFFNTWIHANDSEKPRFDNDQALFNFGKAKACLSMREMQSPYGILPIPMYSDDQEVYYSQVSAYGDSIFAVPIANVENREMIGATLELLGYYSYYEIYPDLFEVVLQDRGAKDQESKDILALIFSNRIYDMGVLYDPHHLTDKVLRITNDNTTGVASHWDKWLNERKDTLEKINDLYAKYNDPDYVADEE